MEVMTEILLEGIYIALAFFTNYQIRSHFHANCFLFVKQIDDSMPNYNFLNLETGIRLNEEYSSWA